MQFRRCVGLRPFHNLVHLVGFLLVKWGDPSGGGLQFVFRIGSIWKTYGPIGETTDIMLFQFDANTMISMEAFLGQLSN